MNRSNPTRHWHLPTSRKPFLATEKELRKELSELESSIFDLESEGKAADSANLADLKRDQFYASEAYDSLLQVIETHNPEYFQLKYGKACSFMERTFRPVSARKKPGCPISSGTTSCLGFQ